MSISDYLNLFIIKIIYARSGRFICPLVEKNFIYCYCISAPGSNCCFKKSKKYLSVATAVPASTFASDKGKIFNENIQELYSTLGTPDDLDAVSGLGTLDTLYLTICDKLSLPQYYHTNGTASRQDAADRLKKILKYIKANMAT